MAATCPLIAFLCLSGALLTAGAAVKNDQGCSEGWTPFGTRCFKFFDSKSTWTESEKICQSHGANLASIHSAEENVFTIDLVKEATGEYRRTWIGGQDAVQEKLWMWSDGSVWDYSNWASHQPDNLDNKDHFDQEISFLDDPAMFWNDALESWTLDYICAKDTRPKPEPEDKDTRPKPEPEDRSASLTMEGFLCKCSPDMK